MRCLLPEDKYIKCEYLKVNCKEWEAKHSTENVYIWYENAVRIVSLKGEEIVCR